MGSKIPVYEPFDLASLEELQRDARWLTTGW